MQRDILPLELGGLGLAKSIRRSPITNGGVSPATVCRVGAASNYSSSFEIS